MTSYIILRSFWKDHSSLGQLIEPGSVLYIIISCARKKCEVGFEEV